MKTLKKYVNQPYPFYFKGKKLFQISVVIFSLSFFFNYVFEPFEVNEPELKFSYFWVSIIHSLSPFLALIPVSLFVSKNHKKVENWKLKYEFTFIAVLLLLTGIIQFLLRDLLYDNPENWSWFYLKEEIINTIYVGSILAFIIVSANLNIQFFKNSEKASTFNSKLKNSSASNSISEVFIETELKSENFKLNLQDFVFAKSQGNYVELYVVENSRTKPILKRLKLKDLEIILEPFNHIIRTHRSYLLNTDYIENVYGNAQGYKIQLKDCEDIVPVSRNYLEAFNSKMQS
ncbi:transcriptional regulator, LytTR family [Flavobacteriaceae bacterium MAR_2010_188]|nr:transcriptional regulator, LytTR family [Flavobacteriaceae bacterium MAR_2010_188]